MLVFVATFASIRFNALRTLCVRWPCLRIRVARVSLLVQMCSRLPVRRSRWPRPRTLRPLSARRSTNSITHRTKSTTLSVDRSLTISRRMSWARRSQKVRHRPSAMVRRVSAVVLTP